MILSSRFPVVKLKDFVYFQEGPGIRNHQNTSEGIRFLNIRCFVDGRLDTKSMKRVSEEEALGKYKHFLLDAGDYVVSSSGTLGRIAEVYPEDLPVMLNTSTIRFRSLDESKLDRLYLRYFLESHVFQEQVKLLATGSVQLNYGPSHLALVEMPLPTIQEQREIGKFLDTLTKGIQLNIEMSKTLEAMAQSIFKSWFVDFDPVKEKVANLVRKGFDDLTASLFPDSLVESELGLIPTGWGVQSVGSISRILGGKMLSRAEFSIGGNYPIFGGAGVMGKTNRSNAEGFVITVGRVGAYCGQFFYHRGLAWVNNNASRIIPLEPISGEWLYLLLKNFDIDSIKKGAAQPFVSNSDLAKSSVLLPPQQVIARFTELVRPFFEYRESLTLEAELLGQLRDSLLPRLIKGELEIPEEMLAS